MTHRGDRVRGAHRGARRRGGRRRAVLSLAVVLVVAVGGTGAFWTDTATVTTAPIVSGSMDLQVSNDGSTWGAVNLGQPQAATHIATTRLVPGESYAFPLSVRTVGDVPTDVTAAVRRASTPTWTYQGTPVTVRVFAGGTPTGQTATYPVQQTCGSGTALGPARPVTDSAVPLLDQERRLSPGSPQTWCVVVAMSLDATSDNQNRTGAVRIDLDGTQVAP